MTEEEIKAEIDNWLYELRKNSWAVNPPPEEYLTEELCLEAVRACNNDDGLLFIPDQFMTPKVCMEGVRIGGMALRCVAESDKTMELCLEAVKQNGQAIEYVPEEMRTPELCFKAVRQNGNALFYIPIKMKTEKICVEAMKSRGWELNEEVPIELREKTYNSLFGHERNEEDSKKIDFNIIEFDRKNRDYIKKLSPNTAEEYFKRARLYKIASFYDKEAIDDFSQAIKLNPDFADAYKNRGYIYNNKRLWDNAIKDFSQAIRINPKDYHSYNKRGFAYCEKGKYDEAISDYTEAIRFDPNDDEYDSSLASHYYGRGKAFSLKGMHDEAIKDFSENIKLHPYDISHVERGMAYYKNGDYDKAIADYSMALDSDIFANSDIYFKRGMAYCKKSQWDKAIEDFTAAINSYFNHAAVYHYRAEAYRVKGMIAEAARDYEEALYIDPDYLPTNSLLAFRKINKKEYKHG